MTDVQVTTIETEPEPEGDVLAEAAVASAAVSGAAAATAAEAAEDAERAEAVAEAAGGEAASAAAIAEQADIRSLSTEEKLDRLITLDLMRAERDAAGAEAPAPAAVVEGPPKEEAPKSVAKKVEKGKTFADRWLGR